MEHAIKKVNIPTSFFLLLNSFKVFVLLERTKKNESLQIKDRTQSNRLIGGNQNSLKRKTTSF